jgi:cardiolipin synthase
MMKWIQPVIQWSLWEKFTKLEWTLMIVGGITLFFIFITLFTSLSDNTRPPTVTNTLTLKDLPQFEATLATAVNSQVEKGSPISILTNGQEFLPDLLTEIKNAQQSIYITDFIWEDGTFGHTLFTALTEKAQQGVRVRVLVDGIDGRNANKDDIKALTAAGGKFDWFRPIKWWNITRINNRTHVRDFVIDGKVSYIGGMAVSDNWFDTSKPATFWHDYMFKSSGAMAARANTIFGNMWSQTTGENLSATPSFTTVAAGTHGTEFVPLFSTPAPDLSGNVQHFIWLSIMAAQHSIHIENPYLVPNKAIVAALKSKAEQGVEVELIVPGAHTDSLYTKWASQSFYTSLLASGVKIYEYQPSRIHAKMMTMDGVWSVVGSANLDNRSSEINLEAIMGIHDPQFAKDLEAKFAADKQDTIEVTKKQWDHKSIWMMPIRIVSRLFIHQF